METVTESAVMEALRGVQDPAVRKDLVSLGAVKGIAVHGGNVTVDLSLTAAGGARQQIITEQCQKAIGALPGVEHVEIKATAAPRTTNLTPPRPDVLEKKAVPGLKNIIGIASGKGGVGKSTVSVNLACALAQSGAAVGLLDADIYGPSIPMMMNAFEELHGDSETRKLIPLERHGVKLMSIAFINPDNNPIIWRGPIVSRAIQQLIQECQWGELDYLLVDLPPGTGDAPLTLAQAVPLSGVIIVMTPQDVATNIAAKSLAMFQRPPFEVPILGIVENMSTFACPHCGKETEIFGPDRGEAVARDFGVPFLGSLPLNRSVAASGDAGKPIDVSAPDSPHGQVFLQIVRQLSERLGLITQARDDRKPGAFLGLERLFNARRKPAG